MDGNFGLTRIVSGRKLGVLFPVLRPVARASAASGQGEVVNLEDFGIAHGPLHEEVLAPSAVRPTLFALLSFLPPAPGFVGRINLLQEPLEAFSAGHLQVAEESLQNLLAILEIDTSLIVFFFGGQHGAQFVWHEDRRRIHLHHPRHGRPPAVSLEPFPGFKKNGRVEIVILLVIPVELSILLVGWDDSCTDGRGQLRGLVATNSQLLQANRPTLFWSWAERIARSFAPEMPLPFFAVYTA